MENEIVAPRDGVVSGLAVAAGRGRVERPALCIVAEPGAR